MARHSTKERARAAVCCAALCCASIVQQEEAGEPLPHAPLLMWTSAGLALPAGFSMLAASSCASAATHACGSHAYARGAFAGSCRSSASTLSMTGGVAAPPAASSWKLPSDTANMTCEHVHVRVRACVCAGGSDAAAESMRVGRITCCHRVRAARWQRRHRTAHAHLQQREVELQLHQRRRQLRRVCVLLLQPRQRLGRGRHVLLRLPAVPQHQRQLQLEQQAQQLEQQTAVIAAAAPHMQRLSTNTAQSHTLSARLSCCCNQGARQPHLLLQQPMLRGKRCACCSGLGSLAVLLLCCKALSCQHVEVDAPFAQRPPSRKTAEQQAGRLQATPAVVAIQLGPRCY